MIQYLCVAAPALFAGLVQGVTGFGAGILLMMFYPFCFSMVQSSAMCQLLCAVLCISIVWRYRRFVRFRMCILPLVFYFPVYLAAMQAAARLDMDYLKPVLGIFLIALAVYFILGEGKIKISAIREPHSSVRLWLESLTPSSGSAVPRWWFIRWGKTPASTGGEEQICISGGCQSPI